MSQLSHEKIILLLFGQIFSLQWIPKKKKKKKVEGRATFSFCTFAWKLQHRVSHSETQETAQTP